MAPTEVRSLVENIPSTVLSLSLPSSVLNCGGVFVEALQERLRNLEKLVLTESKQVCKSEAVVHLLKCCSRLPKLKKVHLYVFYQGQRRRSREEASAVRIVVESVTHFCSAVLSNIVKHRPQKFSLDLDVENLLDPKDQEHLAYALFNRILDQDQVSNVKLSQILQTTNLFFFELNLSYLLTSPVLLQPVSAVQPRQGLTALKSKLAAILIKHALETSDSQVVLRVRPN